MNYPEILRDFMAMSILDNPKRLAGLFADKPELFSKEGIEHASDEETNKAIEEFNKDIKNNEELKRLDELLDNL